RGFAGTVRSHDADAVTALHPDRESIDDLAFAIGPADVLGFDDQLAGLLRFGGGKVGIARRAAILPPLLAQRMEIAKPLDVALAAAGNAVAQPMLLVDNFAVELVLVALFLRQHLVAPSLESAEAAIDPPDLAAVEPGGGALE